MTRNRLGAALSVLALAAIVGGALWITHRGGAGIAYSDSDKAYNRAYWQQEIKAKGVQAAYQEFIQKNSAAPLQRQHFAAHVMGELLDETMGAEGVTVCDANFGFGCFHGFFGRAIAEGGEASIPKLDAACVAKYGPLGTGCQHGIGHGILEYVGYDSIEKALDLCKETTQLVPLLGCTSGVFMEYHQRLAGAGENVQPQGQTFDPAHPYDPCPKVGRQYQASCYYELGYWLPSALGSDEAAGKVCAGLSGSDRQHCYLGLGSVLAPMKQYDMGASLAFCGSLPGADQLACRAGVSWAFYSDPAHKDQAGAACGYASPDDAAACGKLADLTEGREGH